jgi:hypothetical protein
MTQDVQVGKLQQHTIWQGQGPIPFKGMGLHEQA